MSRSESRPSSAPPSRRVRLSLALLLIGSLSYACLGVSLSDLAPEASRWEVVREFLGGALRPALDYEDRSALPASAGTFAATLAAATWRTLVFALTAWSLALLMALPMTLLGARSFWSDVDSSNTPRGVFVRRCVRGIQIGLRSVHELLWAVVLLAALGLSPGTGILALALPMAGTMAKVFGDLLDENAVAGKLSLRSTGGTATSVFICGVIPRALPDMLAFAFYRLECSVRSSAVLGFFGFQTLGYHVRQSFENLHYREVWSALYVLIALVLVLELWSALLRRRFVA